MKSLLISLFIALLSYSTVSQTVYTWNGSVNSQFSTAGNWTPFRQYMYSTDILIIENSGNIIITNVNQITVGQLIIRNNTNVSMSPNTGNPRVLSIQGLIGEDFVIESGSSLSINGDDPKLSIYIKSGATASISGNLTFSGTQAHNINSQNEEAIKFKNGSYLYQNNPGHIFSNTGVQNSVIFENGATIVMNNPGALPPFGLNAPASKVIFEKGSNFIFNSSPSASMKINGRTLPNIKINNGINVNLYDTLTNGITFDSLYLSPNSSFTIANSLSGSADININGNLNINGNFSIGNSQNNIYNINLNSTEQQNILGNGNIDFPYNSSMIINSSTRLLRDLSVNCYIIINNGSLNPNGYLVAVKGKVLSSFYTGDNKKNNRFENNNEPKQYSLSQNYPNPFNSQTNIEFQIPSNSNVNIKLFDITGKLVSEILNKEMQAGAHKVNFDSKDISSGVYFYEINAGGFSKTLKMIVVK